MLSLLKSIDIIGPSPYIFINKTNRYKSTLGGFFTLILSILAILAFFAFGLDVFSKEKPEVLLTRQFDNYPVQNYNETMFLLSPVFRGSVPIQDLDRKLKLTFQYADTDGSRNGTKTFYTIKNMVRCNETNKFQENWNNVSSALVGDRSNYFCIPDEYDLPLENKFGTAKFKIIIFYVK
jgi:hypothetical protein